MLCFFSWLHRSAGGQRGARARETGDLVVVVSVAFAAFALALSLALALALVILLGTVALVVGADVVGVPSRGFVRMALPVLRLATLPSLLLSVAVVALFAAAS